VAKKHKEETMAKYTNDEEYYAMSYDQRLQMLVEAFGADENEEETS
jgi:hypothetical protein